MRIVTARKDLRVINMSGTKAGALKARKTMIEKYGESYYTTIGTKGGYASTGGGFGQGEAGRRRASIAGRKGGRRSAQKRQRND